MAKAKGKEKGDGSQKALIGITVGIVVVVAIAIVCALLMRGSSIGTIEDFKVALTEKQALNCTITDAEGTPTVMQATEGFDKVKLVTEEEGAETNVLMIEGDATYIWRGGDESLAYKMHAGSFLDDFIAEIDSIADEDAADDEGYTLKCESTKKSNFDVPADIDFVDLTDLMGSEE